MRNQDRGDESPLDLGLYVVSTPIGNLEDITLRAIRVLRKVDLILAEDTRKAAILLQRYRIRKPVMSCFPGNERGRAPQILDALGEGKSVALISESGTPCFSDPGMHVVAEATRAGFSVIPIPGPSSMLACLASTGFSGRKVLFLGFLPRRTSRKKRELEAGKMAADLLVILENPHRMQETLKVVRDVLQDPEVTVGREMTKLHEEFLRGRASEVLQLLEERPPRGEMVLAVHLTERGVDQDGED